MVYFKGKITQILLMKSGTFPPDSYEFQFPRNHTEKNSKMHPVRPLNNNIVGSELSLNFREFPTLFHFSR
jgi:hypothetical protein